MKKDLNILSDRHSLDLLATTNLHHGYPETANYLRSWKLRSNTVLR